MTMPESATLVSDIVEMPPVTTDWNDTGIHTRSIVQLNPDHPGFRDSQYRTRRDAIARIAEMYIPNTPIPDAPYTSEEQDLWGTIIDMVVPQHQRHACAEYLACANRLDLPHDHIPQLQEVSARVEALSGFRLEPVAGLVEPRVFLESLANGVFLSTQYIRHYSTPFYTPEPDVVHEVLGHAVTLASERLAELNQLVGHAVKRTRSKEKLERLACLYWFTIEFGVLYESGAVKAYGAGLLSSAGEMEAMHNAELRPFDLDAASRQPYDPTHYQPVLFCAGSFEEMYRTLKDYLRRWH
ncbi:MAG TPA: phenylalanine 4-monooxygenase [Pyrinomonadaceae bacterium]|nr:phenylalanine 4-monooxygenase [Pyrinomonadaceae bacterium]